MIKISQEIRYILYSALFLFATLLAARAVFFLLYSPADALAGDLAFAFYLGMKFDARMVAWFMLPLILLFQTRYTSLTAQPWAQFIARYYLQLVGIALVLIAMVDVEFYDYQHERVSAISLSYLDDINASLGMVVETYPIFSYGLIILIYAYLHNRFMSFLGRHFAKEDYVDQPRRLYRVLRQTGFVFLTLLTLYGSLSVYGLRWSNAFFTQNREVSNLVFNPIHYFYDTMKQSKTNYDVKKVKNYYPLMADYLGFTPNKEWLDYSRHYPQQPHFKPRNVVVIILESFSWYKTGTSGNPGNPSASKNFDEIAADSLLFTNHYVPVPGTSFSLWSVVTGIPDFNPGSRASHNPFIVDQRVVMNEFKDYDRYFFYSDNANWGNVRAFLGKNIAGLRIVEENDFEGERISTWGVSDIRVFNKANELFRDSEKPFVSIILTSGNHRPFKLPTDPKDLEGFEWVDLSDEELAAAGFLHNEEYNSYRYLDHSLGHFIRIAKKEDYFKDTMFVVLGDHGDHAQAGIRKNPYGSEGINRFHVPLAFYSPDFIKPERNPTVASELDIFPTIAGLLGMEYNNYTLGRDLLHMSSDKHYALVRSFSGRYGLLSDQHYYLMNAQTRRDQLYRPFSDDPGKNIKKQEPGVYREMKTYTDALKETTLYLLENNKKPINKAWPAGQKPQQ